LAGGSLSYLVFIQYYLCGNENVANALLAMKWRNVIIIIIIIINGVLMCVLINGVMA
jgi:hypothetical protein